MKFIRVSTRLYCDIYEAYRALTADRRLVKYFNLEDECLYVGERELQINISQKEPYQKVEWTIVNEGVKATFHIMQCTAKTEYCTEVHLMLHKQNTGLTEPEVEKWRLIGRDLLEVLREHYNKDWVISDEDLNRGEFRGSF